MPTAAAILFVALMAALSLWANHRFYHHPRLPMQWSWRGTVNSAAPRALALSIMPALTAATLAATLFLGVPEQGDQNGETLRIILANGTIFVAVHLLHLGLIAKQLGPKNR